MSTWGGIGEGLTAGMNARIALEEQRRKERQAQTNADREFQFRQEQAERAQANADRTFEAGREDAANARSNTDRAFNEGVRRVDMAQANADREYALKQDEAALKSDIASAELSLKQDEMAIKRESQDWSNKINAERLNQFQMQNDELAQSWKKKQEEERMVQETGRNQLAHGIYMMKHGSDSFPTAKVQLDGREMEARVMPEEMRAKLVGAEGPLKDVSSFLLVNTDKGWVPAIQKQTQNGPTVIPFDDAQQYDIFESVNKGFGDREMREYKEKRDLGLKITEAEGKAMATAKATMASDKYGRKRRIDSARAVLQSSDASETQRATALKALEEELSYGKDETPNPADIQQGGDRPERFGYNAKQIAELERRGYKWDTSLYEWVKSGNGESGRRRITAPVK